MADKKHKDNLWFFGSFLIRQNRQIYMHGIFRSYRFFLHNILFLCDFLVKFFHRYGDGEVCSKRPLSPEFEICKSNAFINQIRIIHIWAKSKGIYLDKCWAEKKHKLLIKIKNGGKSIKWIEEKKKTKRIGEAKLELMKWNENSIIHIKLNNYSIYINWVIFDSNPTNIFTHESFIPK